MYLFYPDVFFTMQAIEIYYALSVVELMGEYPKKRKKKLVVTLLISGLETGGICMFSYFWYVILVHLILLPLAVGLCFYRKKEPLPGREWLLCYLSTIMFYGVSQWEARVFHCFSIWTELFTTAGLYGIFRLLQYRKKQRQDRFPVRIFYQGVQLSGSALYDSGNLLYEPVSGKPVSMAEEDWLQPVLALYEKPRQPVCYHTVAGSGVTEVIVADRLAVCRKGKWQYFEEPRIGILPKGKLGQGRCQMLLHTSTLQ